MSVSNKVLCIYAAFAKNKEYQDNVHQFVKHGGIVPHVDYVFVVNEGSMSLELPNNLPNVTVLDRQNTGLDFGAWAHALLHLDSKHEKPVQQLYESFIFINSSVRGPFGLAAGEDWTQRLTSLITGEVLLAGLTINVLPYVLSFCLPLAEAYGTLSWRVIPHVQSMMFATNRRGMDLLRADGIFDQVPLYATMNEVIGGREVRMSLVILTSGWNISCLASKYRGIDYRSGAVRADPNPTSKKGDPFYPGRYWGETVDPNEVMFYKTARLGVIPAKGAKLLESPSTVKDADSDSEIYTKE